jgi:phospholipid/cholesterol/gamma-HCH transport system substrate-binding protein
MRSLLIKVAVLLTVTVVLAGILVVEFDNLQFQPDHTYKAMFTNVSGLKSGDNVKAASVEIGRVDSLQLQKNNQILVTFTSNHDVPITKDTTLTVRYQDMLGNRYLEVNRPTASASALTGNETIPATQTQPALSLDALFNGFQPLFQGLQPAAINQLSAELVSVMQGEGGTIDGLLTTIGSLTNTLANRDKLIGQVISNLNSVLGAVSKHDTELDSLVVNLQQLVSGLSADRNTIGDSLGGIANVSGTLAGLLQQARPDISGTIDKTGQLSTKLNQDTGVLNKQLTDIPQAYQDMSRQGLYGSFFNFYLCGVQVRTDGVTTPMMKSEVQRCQG